MRPQNKLSRRNFLLAVGAGGAVATTALVAKQGSDGAETVANEPQTGKGYRVTQHIRNYYRTTKV
jgi:hypothetical protein